ncbi:MULTISPECIES: H-NS histone family protein [unclassified Polaromonas]|jgi:DNA-binding protein H-NS|uniref:H-NS histone family protein n=1 Tax=unclassified Polaromonas TaxID=2638319 RepID=UPI000BDB3D87|nr:MULTISPECIES: H-NS histone family protein [unclassified Polaromonas]OYY39766.1 MAG: histone [Polaromonas sp. 35-63-35]OYZ22511.1 MAG: histone [Polaromonas sp. 16-63-31]OYZ81273.1 MAG: histone [Polaromonas sp. 24-63-21]OZA52506.1 MAG: histone [Polaromonas sp. 17-63-33]OZA88634.1 MAG: histone [Polaromonas sp. 39-63-25]
MSISSELQQQINQAEAKVNELREKLAEQKNTERAQAITSAKELIKTFQLTATDLGFSGKKLPVRKERAMGDKRMSVAPKYQDPASGKTWTGRGKTPAWLTAQLAAGHSKQDYLIK